MGKGKPIDRTTQARFLRFLVSGATVMAVQTGTMGLLSHWSNQTAAFVTSYIVGLISHYSLNRFWALRSSRTDLYRQAGEYLVLGGTSCLTNYLLFQAAVHLFGLKPVWAMVVSNPPTTIVMFLLLNFRVFRA